MTTIRDRQSPTFMPKSDCLRNGVAVAPQAASDVLERHRLIVEFHDFRSKFLRLRNFIQAITEFAAVGYGQVTGGVPISVLVQRELEESPR